MQKGDLVLGKKLVDKGVIRSEQLDVALKEQSKTGNKLTSVIVRLGYAPEEQVHSVLSEQLGIPYVRTKDLQIPSEAIKKVSAKIASHYKLMPIKLESNTLTIAVTDPLDLPVIDDLKLLLGCDINAVLGSENDILDGIRKYYGIGADTVDKIMKETGIEAPTITEAKEAAEEMAEDASIIKFVNQILEQAVADRSTDIHIEPFEDELRIRYRVDGILYNASIPPSIKYLHSAIVSRIKIMSSLNIAEKRLPQDGRIRIRVQDQDLDLRVSIVPTSYGESVHIRILSVATLLNLERLGLSKSNLEIIEGVIKRPHGIVFVTGPTGSGKTTTLYACLSSINDAKKNIITIEDPIEYQHKGITQIQIHPKIGLSFAEGLRYMLRHDPDIMMVGEVRDIETAEITIRVALTGHLVFSTLHTNNAPGVATRLLDMGIEPYLVASSVECALAQRLVRLICQKCKREIKVDSMLVGELGLPREFKGKRIYEGKGCPACKFTGFKGRIGVFEIMLMNEQIRKLVLERTPATRIKEIAVKLGMRTLFDDGLEKVIDGVTTIGEILRVTRAERESETGIDTGM